MKQIVFPAKNEAKLFHIRHEDGRYLKLPRSKDGAAQWVEEEGRATTFQARYHKSAEEIERKYGVSLKGCTFDANIESGWAL